MRAPTPGMLALLLLLGSCAGTHRADPARAPRLDRAQAQLELALAQQGDPSLWSEVAQSARKAELAFTASGSSGQPSPAVQAGQATARAVGLWQTVLKDSDAAWLGDPEGGPAPELQAELDGRVEQIVDLLRTWTDELPAAVRLLADVLFEVNRPEKAAAVLEDGLERWPADTALHELARLWSPSHPDPARLVGHLDEWLCRPGAQPALEALARATQGYLWQALAATTYEAGDLEQAARQYEAATDSFTGAGPGPSAEMDPFELRRLRAANLTMAGWSLYYLGVNAGSADGTSEQVQARLRDAEGAFVRALELLGEHEQAILGLGYVGNHLVQGVSMSSAREFFGRVALRFDRPEWWNNLGFLCRETGTAAEQAGDTEQATRLYERSFDAYERCIELSPDNARWVNDTGLMLLYHLQRDLDRAEELFHRAWKLGRKVCDNPFVSDESYQQNFEAYTDAMLNLARLHQLRDDVSQAREIVDELLELAPDRPDAQQLRESIRLPSETAPETVPDRG